MQVHLNAAQVGQTQEGELSLSFIKKYIGYCRKYVLLKICIKCLEIFVFSSLSLISTLDQVLVGKWPKSLPTHTWYASVDTWWHVCKNKLDQCCLCIDQVCINGINQHSPIDGFCTRVPSKQVLTCNIIITLLRPAVNVVPGFLRKLLRCSRIVMFSCEVEHVITKKMQRKRSTYPSLSGKTKW